MTSPTVADRLTKLGADPVTSTPAEFLAMIKSEMAKWRKVITTAKISVK